MNQSWVSPHRSFGHEANEYFPRYLKSFRGNDRHSSRLYLGKLRVKRAFDIAGNQSHMTSPVHQESHDDQAMVSEYQVGLGFPLPLLILILQFGIHDIDKQLQLQHQILLTSNTYIHVKTQLSSCCQCSSALSIPTAFLKTISYTYKIAKQSFKYFFSPSLAFC